jgi:hypothetical protein
MKYAVEMGSGTMIYIYTYQVSYRLVQTFKNEMGLTDTHSLEIA